MIFTNPEFGWDAGKTALSFKGQSNRKGFLSVSLRMDLNILYLRLAALVHMDLTERISSLLVNPIILFETGEQTLFSHFERPGEIWYLDRDETPTA